MRTRFASLVMTALAGLAAMTGLSLAGGSAQAQPAGGGSAQAQPAGGGSAQLIPGGHEWWLSNWQVPQKVWPLTGGSGVTVAVLDTGVQASVPDLRGVVRPGLDLTGHGSRGEADLADGEDGHGTAVSVLIAGQGYGTGTVGVAPRAKILPVAFPSRPGPEGGFTADAVATAVRFAVDHGARVINMSFGVAVASTSSCDPVEQDAFAYALEHDVVLVASAGNIGATGTGPIEPATCAGVLAVGGTEPDGSLWPGSDRQPYVAVTAPGDRLVYVGRDEQYSITGDGTSLSGALISGEAALIVSRYPGMPWFQVDQRIIDTAIPAGSPVPNDAYGFGLADPAKAVNAAAYPVSAAGPDPVYAAFKTWLATSGGRAFARQASIASRPSRPASAGRPSPSAGRPVGSDPVLGRIVLVAVAVAAVSAFTVLQVMARSRRPRSPAARGRQARAVHDWRTLPPQYCDDAGNDEVPFREHDDCGPLWRYGAPRGYARDYGPEHGPGHGPGYPPAAWPPRSTRQDAPDDWRS